MPTARISFICILAARPQVACYQRDARTSLISSAILLQSSSTFRESNIASYCGLSLIIAYNFGCLRRDLVPYFFTRYRSFKGYRPFLSLAGLPPRRASLRSPLPCPSLAPRYPLSTPYLSGPFFSGRRPHAPFMVYSWCVHGVHPPEGIRGRLFTALFLFHRCSSPFGVFELTQTPCCHRAHSPRLY